MLTTGYTFSLDIIFVGPPEYICQVFYKQTGINCWRTVLSFFLKDFHEVCALIDAIIAICIDFVIQEVKELYLAQYIEVGPTVDLQLQNEQIKISAGIVDGWSCEITDHSFNQHVCIVHT